jgi:hypothetical protein
MFVKHPLPQDWPQFFRIPVLGSNEISQAWNMRTWLDADAGQFKHAIMLPPETITVEEHTDPREPLKISSLLMPID